MPCACRARAERRAASAERRAQPRRRLPDARLELFPHPDPSRGKELVPPPVGGAGLILKPKDTNDKDDPRDDHGIAGTIDSTTWTQNSEPGNQNI